MPVTPSLWKRWLAPLFAGAVLGSAHAAPAPSLQEVFRPDFLVGVALNAGQFSSPDHADAPLIRQHFNSITAENSLKWGPLHPKPDQYTFEQADRFVEFGTQQGWTIIGHTLVWHSQTPPWVFQDQEGKPTSREVLLERMRDHIRTVVGRYQGRIHGWDVVNEALNDDGTLRNSPWLRTIGEDYLVQAFQFAHAADPKAELYYNDYSLEGRRKREGALQLLRKLQAAGVHLTGVGLQGHYSLEHPSAAEIDDTLAAFAALGLKVMITELDVNVLPTPGRGGADINVNYAADPKWNPYPNGLPPEVEQRLARRYEEIFRVFLKHREALTRVTFWGATDRSSWLNHFPVRGRTNYPLLFDRAGQPKPAFQAVVDLRRTPANAPK